MYEAILQNDKIKITTVICIVLSNFTHFQIFNHPVWWQMKKIENSLPLVTTTFENHWKILIFSNVVLTSGKEFLILFICHQNGWLKIRNEGNWEFLTPGEHDLQRYNYCSIIFDFFIDFCILWSPMLGNYYFLHFPFLQIF